MTTFQVMPRLGTDEYADLEQSIRADGVIVPIVVSADGHIVDGHHRAEIADRLGIDCPRVVKHGDQTELRTFAYTLNLHRRHLTREQRRELIAQSLRQDPQLSNRDHARRTGASHPTVAVVRQELEQTGDVESLSTRTDSLGRQQPATKPAPVTDPWAERIAAELAASDADYAAMASGTDEDIEDAEAKATEPSAAVTDFLESSQAVKDSGYTRAFLAALHRSHAVLGFDPERLADLLNDTETQAVADHAASLARFTETLRRGRRGLRVINGGE